MPGLLRTTSEPRQTSSPVGSHLAHRDRVGEGPASLADFPGDGPDCCRTEKRLVAEDGGHVFDLG